MFRKEEGNRENVMSTMKPIQATPELSGKDAEKILNQVNTLPTENAYKKNVMLHSILDSIRKS